jgi:hypothetical protein
VVINVTQTGAINAVVSGLFFDPGAGSSQQRAAGILCGGPVTVSVLPSVE